MSRRRNDKSLALGVAWFKREQWQQLREVSSDKGQLEQTYDEWHELACRKVEELEKSGLAVKKVELDVQEWVQWCKEEGSPCNSESRASYVAERLRQSNK